MAETDIQMEGVNNSALSAIKELRYKCPKCYRLFKNTGHMKCHFYRVHSEFRLTDFLVLSDDPPETPTCSLCHQNFPSLEAKNAHECVSTILGPPYTCDKCGRLFTTKSSLVRHCISVHTNEKNHVCTVCKKAFATSTNLLNHMRTHENKETGSGCENNSTEAEDHDEKSSQAKKKFPCELCNKKLANRGSLKAHMFTHRNDKLFECDVCLEGFDNVLHLNEHYRAHLDDKPYVCETCNASFTEQSALDDHYRTHTDEKPFTCEMCDLAFTTEQKLKAHTLKMHKNMKTFKCSVCKKKFKKKCYLVLHMRIHKD